MNIVLMESLGVSDSETEELSRGLIEKGHTFRAYDGFPTDNKELIERGKDADVMIIANHPLPAEVIESAPKLKMISVAFVGIDHVDVDSCKKNGVVISNTGGYCDDAVSELAVGLTLDCLRNISASDRAVKASKGKQGLQGRELAGKTVGIVGTGAIGLRTAELFKVFGCKLIGYSRTQKQRGIDLGLQYCSLDELMSKADIVTIHTPLTPDTKGIIGYKEINLMKEGVILINTSRGPVVDMQALADALNADKIFAGIDVYEKDPPLPQEHPLLTAKNVVCTPHIGFDTKESIARRAAMAFENVEKWLAGEQIRKML